MVTVATAGFGAVTIDRDFLADKAQRLGRLGSLLQRHQGGELGVGLELLLDLSELHELLRELVGVERTGRVLVLELRREQRQEGLEIAGNRVRIDARRGRARGR
jgi:hypothetical protein